MDTKAAHESAQPFSLVKLAISQRICYLKCYERYSKNNIFKILDCLGYSYGNTSLIYSSQKRSMSRSASTFNDSIEDAVVLLQHFDTVHKLSPDNSEVLKRAGLVMAMTAWETYVEDCISECVNKRLSAVNGSPIGNFVSGKLEEELKRFHNPNSEKTRKLFLDYLEIDITESWKWSNIDTTSAKKTLNELIAKRGDAVHRSKSLSNGGIKSPHLVKREELDKTIKFLKNLVGAMELGLKEEL